MKRAIVALLVLLVATRVHAQTAPVFSAAVTGENAGGGTSVTTSTSLTVSGTNRYLLCGIATTGFGYIAPPITSVVFAGSYGLTYQAAAAWVDGSGRVGRIDFYHLVAPPLVSGSITATLDLSAGDSSTGKAAIGCLLYTYVDQTTPHGTPVANSARNYQPTVVVTGTNNTQVVVDLVGGNMEYLCPGGGVGIFPSGTPVTNIELLQLQGSVAAQCPVVLASWQPGGPSSVTNQWFTWDGTETQSITWGSLGIPLNFSAAGGGGDTSGKKMLLLGVGGHP